MRNFKDESFIGQYLSPRLMRAFRLFAIVDDEKAPKLEVSAIHDEAGYRVLREAMSRQYDLGSREPNIQVWSVNLRGDRSLTLRHTSTTTARCMTAPRRCSSTSRGCGASRSISKASTATARCRAVGEVAPAID
jgi:spore cortex formation protein SpoVR/YcgB (stage V sporulation)